MTQSLIDRRALKVKIESHLVSLELPDETGTIKDKDTIRRIHSTHREHVRERTIAAIGRGRARDLIEGHLADGDEIVPSLVNPELVQVIAGTQDAYLFRLATMLWSVPVSQGYGRRLRFLVRDRQNGKLIGLFALGDPVFNQRARDSWIGWNHWQRQRRLAFVMDAYVVGAVPPYNQLLGGKLVASLIASSEIVRTFRDRYGDSRGIISGEKKKARLCLVTVTSALGRSSIYNRLSLYRSISRNGTAPVVRLIRVGTTEGYGHFQFPPAVFSDLRQILAEDAHPYANGHQYGNGPNWRIRVVREGLKKIGLKQSMLRHGIEREVYAMPIASNWREVLTEVEDQPHIRSLSATEIGSLARRRWVEPRAERVPAYRNWRKELLVDELI